MTLGGIQGLKVGNLRLLKRHKKQLVQIQYSQYKKLSNIVFNHPFQTLVEIYLHFMNEAFDF